MSEQLEAIEPGRCPRGWGVRGLWGRGPCTLTSQTSQPTQKQWVQAAGYALSVWPGFCEPH
jgi:hypothetical protein